MRTLARAINLPPRALAPAAASPRLALSRLPYIRHSRHRAGVLAFRVPDLGRRRLFTKEH